MVRRAHGFAATAVAVPGLIALGAVALWRINRDSMWVDEAFALASTNDLGLSLSATKGTMGLYYVGLWSWAQVSSQTWWLRAFSTLGAAVTVLIVAAVARRILPRRVAWVAPLLLVGIPIFAWVAVEVRSYAWECALTAACWWLVLRGVEAYVERDECERRYWVALAAACAVGPLLHGLFVLQMPALLAIALLDRTHRRAMLWRLSPAGIAAVIPTALIYAVGGSGMGALWADGVFPALRVERIWLLSPVVWVAIFVASAVVGGAAVSIRRLAESPSLSEKVAAAAPLLWMISGPFLAVIVQLGGGPFAPYYLAPSAAGLALTATRVFEIREVLPARPRFRGALGVTCGVVLVLAVAFSAVARPIANIEDWRGAAGLVAADVRPGDAIVFAGDPASSAGTGSAFVGFAAAWRETSHSVEPVVISHRRQLADPVIRSIAAVPIGSVERSWNEFERVWLIDYQGLAESSGLLGEQAILADYCEASVEYFRPSIAVYRFERRRSDGGCDTE